MSDQPASAAGGLQRTGRDRAKAFIFIGVLLAIVGGGLFNGDAPPVLGFALLVLGGMVLQAGLIGVVLLDAVNGAGEQRPSDSGR